MVQYIFTPWRDRDELLLVRDQLYADRHSTTNSNKPPQDHEARRDRQNLAVARISMWAQRGSCPHMVESTALLFAAVLSDEIAATQSAGSSTYAVRAAYSAAFSRPEQPTLVEQPGDQNREKKRRQEARHLLNPDSFAPPCGLAPAEAHISVFERSKILARPPNHVCGMAPEPSNLHNSESGTDTAFYETLQSLLDGHQDKLRKQSMYSIAKVIGLPATFVELRHQATHEQLPSLAKLRPAAHMALDWIWDYYWKQLDQGSGVAQDPCKEAVLRYLREEDEQCKEKLIARELSKWEMDKLMATIKDLQTTLPGNQVYLKCMKLKQELLALEKAKLEAPAVTAPPEATPRQPEPAMPEAHEVPKDEESDEDDIGWSKYQGPWKPKPIGIV
ncbi:hypothetical protein PWT90_07411 [Aphanocladium album]|nr:hypothetical protein PWT90_07411 [Aphanocladium album]